jgi:hypothetical protein
LGLTAANKNAKIGLFILTVYKYSTLWWFFKNHDFQRRADASH